MKRLIVLCGLLCPILSFAATTGENSEELNLAPPIGLEERSAAESSHSNIENEIALAIQESADKKAKLKESEIPVLTTVKAKADDSSSPYFRMILSFGIISAVAGCMFFVTRWWKKKTGTLADTTKIRVLTQHHLGPKKSLAIIRVAGESILIGVTDQNISMIKSLSLIDDEFPEVTNNDFAKSLADIDNGKAKNTDRDDVEEFALSQIKDKVSQRIRDMRPLG